MGASSPLTRFQLAEIGALLADPARAAILLALTDGSARPATELGVLAGVAPATASEHLRRLREGGLLEVLTQGRHRYYRLADDDVAHLLETLTIARASARPAARVAQADPALGLARTCYRHLAGRLGVALFERLRAQDGLRLDADAIRLSPHGCRLLHDAGVLDDDAAAARLCGRTCIDWTERRFHLGGALGCHLAQQLFERDWLRPTMDTRALTPTRKGRAGLLALGIEWNGAW